MGPHTVVIAIRPSFPTHIHTLVYLARSFFIQSYDMFAFVSASRALALLVFFIRRGSCHVVLCVYLSPSRLSSPFSVPLLLLVFLILPRTLPSQSYEIPRVWDVPFKKHGKSRLGKTRIFGPKNSQSAYLCCRERVTTNLLRAFNLLMPSETIFYYFYYFYDYFYDFLLFQQINELRLFSMETKFSIFKEV